MPHLAIVGGPARPLSLITPPNTGPAATLSFRDALARADQIENVDEALQLLRLAEISGDDDLARAVQLRAADEVRAAGPDVHRWRLLLADWSHAPSRGPVDLDRLPYDGPDAA